MRSETTVGTEKRKRLVGVSLNAINYRHGAHGEITYFNRRAKIVLRYIIESIDSIIVLTDSIIVSVDSISRSRMFH